MAFNVTGRRAAPPSGDSAPARARAPACGVAGSARPRSAPPECAPAWPEAATRYGDAVGGSSRGASFSPAADEKQPAATLYPHAAGSC